MSAGVELANVCADFGNFRAVDHVNVTVKAGEFFSFLGPSGCGKTTILRMVSGFIDPSEGEITLGGQNMRGIRPNKRPTALIFQNLALFPLMPVWENISFGLEVRGVDKRTRRAKAEELLRLVDLPGSADKSIAQLSGGQKRTNVTFIYITHDQGEALAMSDRVGVMSHGKLQQVATPQEIYNRPANGFVASFVGENNIFTGQIESRNGTTAMFRTGCGTFRASLAPGVTETTPAKLYVRPEQARLVDAPPAGANNIPVEVADVAFEGNFINIQVRNGSGNPLVIEARNDGSTSVPPPGSRLNMVFTPEQAVILADEAAPQGRAA